MPRKKIPATKCQNALLHEARELRQMLAEINQKLDHLIQRCRQLSRLSDSITNEFQR